jgi:DNA helicase IV
LAEWGPEKLDAVAGLRRNQVLVDEATDFSPVQLACMASLASPATVSLFLSGDFNQRLTRWGCRSEQELRWVSPGIQVKRIALTYRQSRKLAGFARSLALSQGVEVDDTAQDQIENEGYDPVFGTGLATPAELARWLAQRISEIGTIVAGTMPTIAVLAVDDEALGPLAEALSVELEPLNIRAVACPRGEVKGQEGDVRVFPVAHIKGLEFEAVFFTDVDKLERENPELFDRYIYVGATRAATFLGLTSQGAKLPSALELSDISYGQIW